MNKGQNNRRGRSRGNGKNRPVKHQSFESNGPSVKVRGTAQQVLEKYLALARDASSGGDRILAESYFQHAEHYYRLINADENDPNRQNQQRGRMNGRAQPADEESPDFGEKPDADGEAIAADGQEGTQQEGTQAEAAEGEAQEQSGRGNRRRRNGHDGRRRQRRSDKETQDADQPQMDAEAEDTASSDVGSDGSDGEAEVIVTTPPPAPQETDEITDSPQT